LQRLPSVTHSKSPGSSSASGRADVAAAAIYVVVHLVSHPAGCRTPAEMTRHDFMMAFAIDEPTQQAE
jgi:hypothetical protein